MKKASYEDILFADQVNQGFCISFYASNHMELARLIDEAKLVARQDISAADYSSLFETLDAERTAIDSFPVAVFINSKIRCFVPIFSCDEELFVVSTSFHIKPLIKVHQRNKDVALLHFTSTDVKLFQVNMKNLVLLDIFKPPSDEQDYLNIDRFVSNLLSEKKLLLVFSGNPESIKSFKKLSLYGNIFDTPLVSTSKNNGRDLIRHIFKHIEPYFRRLESKAANRFINAKKQGRLITDTHEIFSHAINGEIKILFIAEDIKLWGYLDTHRNKILVHNRQMDSFDEDILDDISEIVLKFKGSVVVLPQSKMPEKTMVFGILRDSYEKIIIERKFCKSTG